MESDVPLEEGFRSNLELKLPPIKDVSQLDADIQRLFGADASKDGPIFIAPNGTFINLPASMDVHVDLLYYLIDNQFIDRPDNYGQPDAAFEDPTELAELLNYIRCNNDVGGFAYITLNSTLPTRAQFSSIETWLDRCAELSIEELDVSTVDTNQSYNLIEYSATDILKKIKRYYASGRLYESQAQIDYLPVSDVELFKEYANDILGGFGGMSDAAIKSGIKEINFEGKLAGYIGFSEYEENGHKCLGIGNFMIIERGKGLGSAVIQNIVEKYKNQYDLIYCFVDAKNDGAIRLYKKLGKVYDEDGPNDNGEYYVTFWDNGKWELDEDYDPPYNAKQVRANYGDKTYQRLRKDPAHLWRMRTGIELIHREPSKEELERIWANWQLMSDEQKRISNKKSIELFGKTNAENYAELIKTYN
jgi:RimJ/RimL family protein N-acetyltransferase